jgi:hypothetical protein
MKLFQPIRDGHGAAYANHRITFGSRRGEACHEIRTSPEVTSATPAFPVMRPMPLAMKAAFCSCRQTMV